MPLKPTTRLSKIAQPPNPTGSRAWLSNRQGSNSHPIRPAERDPEPVPCPFSQLASTHSLPRECAIYPPTEKLSKAKRPPRRFPCGLASPGRIPLLRGSGPKAVRSLYRLPGPQQATQNDLSWRPEVAGNPSIEGHALRHCSHRLHVSQRLINKPCTSS